jgi:hypothetical protein
MDKKEEGSMVMINADNILDEGKMIIEVPVKVVRFVKDLLTEEKIRCENEMMDCVLRNNFFRHRIFDGRSRVTDFALKCIDRHLPEEKDGGGE